MKNAKLLVINAENASLKAKKLATMATRTREQLLRSLVDTVNQASTQSSGKRGAPGRGLKIFALYELQVGALIFDFKLYQDT